jgi:hypothetical protein
MDSSILGTGGNANTDGLTPFLALTEHPLTACTVMLSTVNPGKKVTVIEVSFLKSAPV